MKRYKQMAFCLVFSLMVNTLANFPSIATGVQSLSMNQAVAMGVANNDDIALVKLNLVKKGIERKQAVDGIKDIREKESTVRFSLLFNIEFPESHGMPKEIDLLLKLPGIDSEIKKLNAKLIFETQKATYAIKTAYYDVLSARATRDYFTSRVSRLTSDYQSLMKQYLLGKAKQDDLKALKKSLDDASTQLVSAALAIEKTYTTLSDAIGMTVGDGTILEEAPLAVTLNRDLMDSLVLYGLSKDYQVFTATEDRKLAEKTVTEVFEIYQAHFGAKANVLLPYLSQTKIDYASLLTTYENMLNAIDQPWQKVYVINMIFFKIKIPMRWFQGEYTALRYFEDEKYPLIVALNERDEKRKIEATALTETKAKIVASYEAVAELQRALVTAEATLASEKSLYDKLYAENLIGQASYTDVLNQKDAVEAGTLANYQSEIVLRKFIIALDFNTSGGISLMQSGSGFDMTSLSDGVSSGETESDVDTPSWFVSYPYENFQFIFGVHIPEALKITDYQLMSSEGVALSDKMAVTKTFSHLPLTFEDNTLLYLNLYQKDVLVYKAEIDGEDVSGNLVLVPVIANQPSEGDAVGGYSLENTDALRQTLGLQISETLSYTGYAIRNIQSGQLLTTVLKPESGATLLSLSFKDLNAIEIVLYQGDSITAALKLSPLGDGSGQLIYKSIATE